ncbi:MAG TPA: Uma2 family endonuclease [Ktedonobacterales bacterium]|nr:Uma2 family endonuclease [Ktedonobacterales bacterium]
MNTEDLLALPEDGHWQYELVEGRLVRMPGSGFEASAMAMRLGIVLGMFVMPRNLGIITGADGTYNLTQPGDAGETALVPDVAFVRADRLPARGSAEYIKAPRLAPDLVAEVASPSQHRPELRDKAERYLRAGVRLVWLIWPNQRQVDVWQADANGAPLLVATLAAGDALDGRDVLPGFTYPLADLFG